MIFFTYVNDKWNNNVKSNASEPFVLESRERKRRSAVVYIVIGVVITVALVLAISGFVFYLWKRGLLTLPKIIDSQPQGIDNPTYETSVSFSSVTLSDIGRNTDENATTA